MRLSGQGPAIWVLQAPQVVLVPVLVGEPLLRGSEGGPCDPLPRCKGACPEAPPVPRGVRGLPVAGPRLADCFGTASGCGRRQSSCSLPRHFFFLQSFGFSLLARSTYHWQLSFLQAEQVLLQQLDEDGGCRRKCFQALRQMKEDVWCPGKRPVLVSYHLQVSV